MNHSLTALTLCFRSWRENPSGKVVDSVGWLQLTSDPWGHLSDRQRRRLSARGPAPQPWDFFMGESPWTTRAWDDLTCGRKSYQFNGMLLTNRIRTWSLVLINDKYIKYHYTGIGIGLKFFRLAACNPPGLGLASRGIGFPWYGWATQGSRSSGLGWWCHAALKDSVLGLLL